VRDNWTFDVRPDTPPKIGRRGGGQPVWWAPRRTTRHNGGGKYGGGLGYGKQYFSNPRNQRVVTRTPVAMNRTGVSWYKHGTYLQREGAQREGRGLGFDAEGNEVRLPVRLAQWQREGDACLYKIMLSPEHADRIDLQGFARQVMREMEKDLGRLLEWVAIDHRNTPQGHVHVCVRSRDRAGCAVPIARDYLRRGIMVRAGEVLTRELGWKLEPELEQIRERALARERFGLHDRTIQWKLDGQQRVRESELTGLERRRLQHLAKRGLAWEHDGVWEVTFRWQEKMTMQDAHDREGRKQEREQERTRERDREREKDDLTRTLHEQQRRLVRAIDELEREQRRERSR
jgi:hypothetical protein